MAQKKSLLMRNEIGPESVIVSGDENRLQQIMLNLIGNALKFTESGGITISSQKDGGDGDQYVITVSDTGIGIPEDKIDRIFETFEQADGSTAREYGGTGLGLSIVKKLVELHGGRVWVKTEVGKGSHFSFTINASKGTPKKDPDKADLFTGEAAYVDGAALEAIRMIDLSGSGSPDGKRILVVDDEPMNLQVMINYLSIEGCDVITAMTGPEALDKLEHEKVDLVLLDVMLPRMSGYEVCRIIREKYSPYDLPVLMLTAKNKPGDIVTGIEAGANDYLTKPVDKQELLARVRSLISLKVSVRLNNELALIKRDIQIAHDIQNTLLTHDFPRIDGVDIALRYVPMNELGGDFYDVQMIGDNKLAVLLADVSGHGIPAAFICAMLKVVYSFHREDADNPSKLMKSISNGMFNYTGGQFITACYACIDLTKMRISHANAGHWPLLIYRKSEHRIIKAVDNGIPIGWTVEASYNPVESEILPGDRIIMHTDGIIEARGITNKMFGEQRLHKYILEHGECPVDDFVDGIIAAILQWSAEDSDANLKDDVTIIAIDYYE
jgi:two-component system sensor histidine kinase ChiS